jgi:hypothetical protein
MVLEKPSFFYTSDAGDCLRRLLNPVAAKASDHKILKNVSVGNLNTRIFCSEISDCS